MPTNPLEQYTTSILLSVLAGVASIEDSWTVATIASTLLSRIVDEEDDPENLGYRGGTRPTQQPINP